MLSTRPVIVATTRTPVGTAFKGSLAGTPAETMAAHVVRSALERSGLGADRVDDIVLAESHYGGGDLARHAAVATGLTSVPGLAVNRHCAGGLSATAVAATTVAAGAASVVIAGGVQSTSLTPVMKQRVPGTADEFVEPWMPFTHPDSAEAPAMDMSITVGWNTARAYAISREAMDEWALRSHQRAIAAIDDGTFVDEIDPIEAVRADGQSAVFAVDEHPRRSTTAEKLASLAPVHPEIDGFSITAGNASGLNDAAAALVVADPDTARSTGVTALAQIRAVASTATSPRDTGSAAIAVIRRLLDRSGLTVADVALWEINEAFASVPIAACREFGISEDVVNIHGSGCSIGHPIAASGGRMIATLVGDLRRRGGGIGVAAMCAGGGQAGGVVVEV